MLTSAQQSLHGWRHCIAIETLHLRLNRGSLSLTNACDGSRSDLCSLLDILLLVGLRLRILSRLIILIEILIILLLVVVLLVLMSIISSTVVVILSLLFVIIVALFVLVIVHLPFIRLIEHTSFLKICLEFLFYNL